MKLDKFLFIPRGHWYYREEKEGYAIPSKLYQKSDYSGK